MNSKDLTEKVLRKVWNNGRKGLTIEDLREAISETLKECKWEKLKAKLNKSSRAYDKLRKKLEERNTEVKQAIEEQIELVEDGCDEQVESMEEPNYCGNHDKNSHRGIFLCGHCEDTRIRFEELLQKLGLGEGE
jgi:DNA-binding transcriptional MerR regulator